MPGMHKLLPWQLSAVGRNVHGLDSARCSNDLLGFCKVLVAFDGFHLGSHGLEFWAITCHEESSLAVSSTILPDLAEVPPIAPIFQNRQKLYLETNRYSKR